MKKFHIDQLDCANCAARIEKAVQETPGVHFASVDFATTTLFLEAEDIHQVSQSIQRVEPEIRITEKHENSTKESTPKQSRQWVLIIISGFLFGTGLLFSEWLSSTPSGIGNLLVFGVAYVVSGWGVLKQALRDIVRGKIFDENFLMSVATIGAIVIGELPEAVGVMVFYQVGDFVQNLSVQRSRRSIQALLEIRPDKAWILVDGEKIRIEPSRVSVGETILVLPGERIPLDGDVLIGESLVDTAPLTGESIPVRVVPGEAVLAGTINQEGMLTIKVTRPFNQSSIARILDLVESAASRKAKTEKFITRFAEYYSPLVVLSAFGVALIPPLILGASFDEWFYRAMVILVISCPCALVISIPLGYFGGVGGASRKGILVKGSNFLDALSKVNTVVFDKTGTLTQGVFNVTQVSPQNGFSRDDLLCFAAQAESGSNHPIAKSIQKAYGKVNPSHHHSTIEIPGHGVRAVIDGRVILVGNHSLIEKENIDHHAFPCEQLGTVVHVAVEDQYAGCLVVSDTLKPDALSGITALRKAGVKNIMMMSGDKAEISQVVARTLGLDDFKAEMLPEGKVSELDNLLNEGSSGGKVAFVGDGINDAPALARADVGIAMGGLGSEAAIETADVVLMTDSPEKVAEAIELGRKTRRIVWQNISFAILVKIGFIGLGIVGEATMWQAVFADMGVALIAVLNATRVLNTKV